MKKIIIAFIASLTLIGCNSIYKYVFLPPERIEYTLIADKNAMANLSATDTSYYFSEDGLVVGYNAKNWKIEIRYMTDYQLNTFEFPEESKSGEFSGNPYTFGNWIDPKLGYTPRRFTVFKVSVYNYTNSKINYDPELSLLTTDRGDNLHAYGREQKSAKYASLEEYYKKRKGSSGVDEDIFETRMGIVRNTMFHPGKPIYKGDSRDGLIVFDPIVDEIENIKINVNKFVLGYDENNEPSDFCDLVFFFKQVPLDRKALDKQLPKQTDSISVVNFAQIQYNAQPGPMRYEQPWNPLPQSIPNLIEYAQKNLNLKTKFVQSTFDDPEVKQAKIAFLFGGGVVPEFTNSMIKSCADYLSSGGFLYIDNGYFKSEYPYNQNMENFLKEVQKQLSGKAEIKSISFEHKIFSAYTKFTQLPQGQDDITANYEKYNYIKGLFWEGKLIAVISNKGYPVYWSGGQPSIDNQKQLDFGLNLVSYSLKKSEK